jgi:hypothetical protein
MSSQQPTQMSKKTCNQIVEEVYLQSYEDLRKGGKNEDEAYALSMKLSNSVQLVIDNRIALRAIYLYLQSSSSHEDEPHDRNSDDESTNDDESSTTSYGDEEDECHLIPIK